MAQGGSRECADMLDSMELVEVCYLGNELGLRLEIVNE